MSTTDAFMPPAERDRRDFLKTATGILAGCAGVGIVAPRGVRASNESADAAPIAGALVLYQNGETWDEVLPVEGTGCSSRGKFTPLSARDCTGS